MVMIVTFVLGQAFGLNHPFTRGLNLDCGESLAMPSRFRKKQCCKCEISLSRYAKVATRSACRWPDQKKRGILWSIASKRFGLDIQLLCAFAMKPALTICDSVQTVSASASSIASAFAFSASHRSASNAAMQPIPAEVTA